MTTYPINFIKKVLIRIDYQPILKLKQEEPADYQECMRAQFPRYERKETIEFQLKPGEPPIATKSPVWEFVNKDKTEKISLNYQTISITFNKYNSRELFFSKIESVYNAFNSIYRPTIIKKIGLRFINEIKLTGNPLDWEGIINNVIDHRV
ncbi:MAG: TIGR04255 family protein [Proteobacteria bacterium]|nr:TIGR04255 family protein [Pseudomonadota bacterium]MBU4447108.1 TIGR04255 family protein [Pseudomonadota bacterium]MCG2771858.1 TIGR04255 family protein [Desulfobacterales bacterium]